MHPHYGTSDDHRRTLVEGPSAKELLIRSRHTEFVAVVFGGSLLAFNAGFINVVSLLISDILVSHTTGNISKSSVNFANGDYFKFIEVAIMLPCFVLGSTITTLLIEDQTFCLTKSYNRVFVLATTILLVAAYIGIYTVDSQLYAYLATIACGMQNAMTTKYSGSILRTTHTTGMATDIGICFGRILKGKPNELWKLQVQIPLLASFFFGGIVGSLAHSAYGKHAMFICVALFGSIGALYAGTVAYFRKEHIISSLCGVENEEQIVYLIDRNIAHPPEQNQLR